MIERAFGIVCALILVSGCVSGGANSSPPTLSTAPPVAVSASTGSIAGGVFDDERIPLPKVEVAVKGPSEAQTASDAQGRFTMNDLEPGEYVLFAQRLGYEAFSIRATVVAAETTLVNLTLKPIALAEPRIETSTYAGFINGDVYTAGVGLYYPRSFPVNFTEGAMEVVTSAKWQATVPLFARYLRMSLAYEDATNRTTGRSPLTTNISGFQTEDAKNSAKVDYGVTFGCSGVTSNPQGYAQCTANNPDVLVPQIAYQQKVEFFSTVFYYQQAPPGYTGLD